MKRRSTVSLLVLFFFVGSFTLLAEQLVLLKNIKPTHMETEDKYVPLKLVKEIGEEIDDENFFAKPMAIAPGDDGSFFVYDMLLLRIFKFDKDFKLLNVFLKRGQGPSEIQRKTGGFKKIYFTKDGFLTVAAPYNKKIILFDRQGGFVKDIRIPFGGHTRFSPVMDVEGNIYTISDTNPGIDVLDKDAAFKYTLLSNEDYRFYINHKPDYDKSRIKQGKGMESDNINTVYDILDGNRLLIYVKNASTVYLFKGKKLVKTFRIWPEKALAVHRAAIQRLEKRLNSKNFEMYLFDRFFVDKDNEANIYFSGRFVEKDKKKVGMIYKFDLNGKLVNVYYADQRVQFHAKRNDLFYGLFKGSVFIYKIEKSEIGK